MKIKLSALLLSLVACGDAVLSEPSMSEESGAELVRKRQLSVRVRGAGSVLGGVSSRPAGIDCVLDSMHSDRECRADFPRGQPIRLTYSPGGAGMVAQFYIWRGGTWVNCGTTPASAGLTCDLVLNSDTQVQVFPISIPPPPP